MSGGGAANNSWTILTSEETAAETLRPLAEGTKRHEESRTSAAGPGEKNLPANSAESAERLPEEDYLVSEDKTADRRADSSSDLLSSIPPSVGVSGPLDHGNVESRSEGLTQSCPDPDSSPDSYTLLTPSTDGPPGSLLSSETLGGAESSQADEELPQEEALSRQNKEEPHLQGEESGGYPQTADTERDGGVGEERSEKTVPEERRKKSLLEQIGRREEDEEDVEEEFQVPQQEHDTMFSLNKCILAALILLGLGTIFFSEGDYTTRDLKDTEALGKQEWLDPDLLNKLAEGKQQISALQAQLQAQKEELKVAKEQAAEGEKERLLWEEVEKENSRLKTEIASLPVLQKENDRMKKELESVQTLQKELESLRSSVTNVKLPATHQASTKSSTLPSSGQREDGGQDAGGTPEKQPWKTWEDLRQKKDLKRNKYETNDKKQWKEKERSVGKEGDEKDTKKGDKIERKKGKHEHGKVEKDKDKPGKQKRQSNETKQRKEKELKKEKGQRGDDGRPWKDKGGKKELKEERNWKQGFFDKAQEGKEWTGKKEKWEWRAGKNTDQKEEWKGEMEWKKGKHGGKEKEDRKDWREKGEKKDPEWRNNIGKDYSKEGKRKGERKQWDNTKSKDKERTGKDEKKLWNEYERKSKDGKRPKELKKDEETVEQFNIKDIKLKEKRHNVDRKKDQPHSLKKKNEPNSPGNHGHREDHLYGNQKPHHTHPKPSVGQPEYWLQQRERLHHNPRPPQQCSTLETCAQAEGLVPVPLSDFESILQTYLTKAGEAGVDGSKTSELRKLAMEFFKDGMFVHNQRSFQDFADDLADILEDIVEDGGEEDSELEDEMEEFEKEVLKRFSLPGGGEKEKKMKAEWREENTQ